jgi:FG-GAP repeat
MRRRCAAILAAAVTVPAMAAWPAAAASLSSAASPGADIGSSVAISGSTVVAGAPRWDNYRGEVVIYARRGVKWSQQAVLRLGRATTHWQFGVSVAISGSTVVVGANGANGSKGLAYVYIRNGTTWHRQAVLSVRSQKGDSFGAAVGISGSTAVIGAPGQDVAGQVMVFTRHGTTWSRPVVLPGPGRSFGANEFGAAVAASGSQVAVGWPDINSTGTARVFVRASPAIWDQQAYLNGSTAVFGAAFGQSVAISGAVIAVGAPGGSPANGAAYIFTRSKGAWGKRAALEGFSADSLFGNSVGASGANVIVGAPHGGTAGQGQGAAYLYQDSAHKWGQVASISGPSPQTIYNNLFGLSVAISAGTAAIGAPGVNGDRGAVYVYIVAGMRWIEQAQL